MNYSCRLTGEKDVPVPPQISIHESNTSCPPTRVFPSPSISISSEYELQTETEYRKGMSLLSCSQRSHTHTHAKYNSSRMPVQPSSGSQTIISYCSAGARLPLLLSLTDRFSPQSSTFGSLVFWYYSLLNRFVP